MDARTSLRAHRRLWAAFAVGVLGLAAVLTVLADVPPQLPVALPLGLAVALGLGGVAAVEGVDRVFAASPPASDSAGLGELRTRLVLQAVVAETVVLATTIVAFVFGPRWTVALGGVAGAVILWRIRPTRRRLARFDAAWARDGHDVSLLRGLTTGPPGDPAGGPAPPAEPAD